MRPSLCLTATSAAILFVLSTMSAGGTENAADSCVARIKVPRDDRVYSVLANPTYGKVHLTCPINVKKQDEATIYILDEGGLCSRDMLFGYPVISHQLVSRVEANNMYNDCSGVTPSARQVLAGAGTGRTLTYTWSQSEPALQGQASIEAIFGRVAGGVAASGLPISKFVDQNHIFCFEIDADYGKDPLTAIEGIGVPVPDSIRQTLRSDISCDGVFGIK